MINNYDIIFISNTLYQNTGRRLGGHVKAVFFIITFIFIACVTFTITSFTEIPLWVLAAPKFKKPEEKTPCEITSTNYGSINNDEDDFKKDELPDKVIKNFLFTFFSK